MRKLALLVIGVLIAWQLNMAFFPPAPRIYTRIDYSKPIAGTPAMIIKIDPRKPMVSFERDGEIVILNSGVITVTDRFGSSMVFTDVITVDSSSLRQDIIDMYIHP